MTVASSELETLAGSPKLYNFVTKKGIHILAVILLTSSMIIYLKWTTNLELPYFRWHDSFYLQERRDEAINLIPSSNSTKLLHQNTHQVTIFTS